MSTLRSKAYDKLPRCEREKLHKSIKAFVGLNKLLKEVHMMTNENNVRIMYEKMELGNDLTAYDGMGQHVEGTVINVNIEHHNNVKRERYIVKLKNYKLINANNGILTEELGNEAEFDLTNWTIVD